MRIKKLGIKNLRGIENVAFEPTEGLNVIVGPNAVGKTTVLEAIRLAKALLAQRFNGEAGQVLLNFVGNPNPSQGANAQLAALAGNPNIPVEIEMLISLDEAEVAQIRNGGEQLAVMRLQTELARSLNENTLELTQYLSTVEGQSRLQANRNSINEIVASLTANTELNISFSVNARAGRINGADATSQAFLTYLEQTLQPGKAHFNYFTADRALPQGEVAIQLGAGDIQQQLMSYLAQPALKYTRVKQLIVQTILLDANGRQLLTDEFNLIFDELLPGKKLAGVSFNEHGVLNVQVHDSRTGKTFDIDGMSSGEKGLVLTFLTLRLSSKDNTVVLLDEPELHLNAAVCSRIMPFLTKHCVGDKGLQIFVCSHSPEIVRDAFEENSCNLYHLRSANDLSPVLQQDSGEVFEILNRLGSNTADVLFSRGSVFVEGEHDAAILQVGYANHLQGFKVQGLGGRSEVEKEVPRLQQLEKSGKLDKRQLFIFDHDRATTGLQSTANVRVIQLQRYCIENYLLDEMILFDVISANANKFSESRGTFPQALEAMAISQLDSFVIAKVYATLEPENAGLRPKEVRNLQFDAAAKVLWARIEKVQGDVSGLTEGSWQAKFIERCETEKAILEPNWKADWKSLTSGKQLIDQLYASYEVSMKKVEFKKTIMREMAAKQTDTWRVLDSLLGKELG